jgi:hypothetical protein
MFPHKKTKIPVSLTGRVFRLVSLFGWLTPSIHLLAARLVESTLEVVGLAFRGVRITVAGQHRTFTGFVLLPSHPGERHLKRQSSMSLVILRQQYLITMIQADDNPQERPSKSVISAAAFSLLIIIHSAECLKWNRSIDGLVFPFSDSSVISTIFFGALKDCSHFSPDLRS